MKWVHLTKTLYLLVIMVIHNLTYPMSVASGVQPLIFYVVFGAMFVVAVLLLSGKTLDRVLIVVSGLFVFVSGVVNSYAPSDIVLMILYLSVIVYHLVMILVVGRYIFFARRVLTEVILAAVSLYLIIGLIFAAIYGLIEWIQPGSFASSSGTEAGWQSLLYFSYITLTSLGYGDITPAKFYAQSFAAFEAIIGVVYTVVLLSRLVGMQETEKE